MEQTKPAPVEIKVTWGFAWALWWRWMIFSLVLMAVVYIPIVLILVALGLWTG